MICSCQLNLISSEYFCTYILGISKRCLYILLIGHSISIFKVKLIEGFFLSLVKKIKLDDVPCCISALLYAVAFPPSVVTGDDGYVSRILFYLPGMVRESLGLSMVKHIERKKCKV